MPYVRIHTTLCGEWTRGKEECPGGYWLGPFTYEEAVSAAKDTKLRMIHCRITARILEGKKLKTIEKPGYRAHVLSIFTIDEFKLKTIFRYPFNLDVIMEYPLVHEGKAYYLGDYLDL